MIPRWLDGRCNRCEGCVKGHGLQYAVFYGVLEVTVRCAWPEEAIADISEGG